MPMKFLAVDDEDLVRAVFVKTLRQAEADCNIEETANPLEALELIKNGFIPDIAFLDIEMYEMTGLELAKRIKDVSPSTEIVFVTGYSQYALDAFSLHAHGYILKPVVLPRLKDEIKSIQERRSERISRGIEYPRDKLYATCFGNFDVSVNGQQLQFPRQKAKELLAYLIDKKGTSCTTREICAVLFEDKEYSRSLLNQVQSIIAALQKTLKDAGICGVIEKNHNSIAIKPEYIDCDFYRFLAGDIDAVNSYTGEYMANYEWADMTAGWLTRTADIE